MTGVCVCCFGNQLAIIRSASRSYPLCLFLFYLFRLLCVLSSCDGTRRLYEQRCPVVRDPGRHSNPSVLCNFACVCVTLSRFVSVREDLSHVHINNTHVASASSLPLTDLEFGYSSFLLLLPMCRVIITDTVISGSIVCFPVGSLIQCRRANDDFLNFFFFFFGIAPLESHADIYRRQLMFRLLFFFFFFNLYCPDWVSLKKLIEMSLKKK